MQDNEKIVRTIPAGEERVKTQVMSPEDFSAACQLVREAIESLILCLPETKAYEKPKSIGVHSGDSNYDKAINDHLGELTQPENMLSFIATARYLAESAGTFIAELDEAKKREQASAEALQALKALINSFKPVEGLTAADVENLQKTVSAMKTGGMGFRLKPYAWAINGEVTQNGELARLAEINGYSVTELYPG